MSIGIIVNLFDFPIFIHNTKKVQCNNFLIGKTQISMIAHSVCIRTNILILIDLASSCEGSIYVREVKVFLYIMGVMPWAGYNLALNSHLSKFIVSKAFPVR